MVIFRYLLRFVEDERQALGSHLTHIHEVLDLDHVERTLLVGLEALL